MGQKKRATKTSKGIHGATKHPLTELEKVLMGKGMYRRMKPLDAKPARHG